MLHVKYSVVFKTTANAESSIFFRQSRVKNCFRFMIRWFHALATMTGVLKNKLLMTRFAGGLCKYLLQLTTEPTSILYFHALRVFQRTCYKPSWTPLCRSFSVQSGSSCRGKWNRPVSFKYSPSNTSRQRNFVLIRMIGIVRNYFYQILLFSNARLWRILDFLYHIAKQRFLNCLHRAWFKNCTGLNCKRVAF